MQKAIVILLLMAVGINAYAQSGDDKANKRVDSFINAKMKSLAIPGMAVAVVKNGKILKMTAYGMANLEWERKVTTHSTFQMASCTKLLTSTLLLKAIHSGKIKLDDHIDKYIDSIPPQWKALQVKHLINHSSGLKDFNGNLYLSTAAVVRSLKDSTLRYAPGTGQNYAQADFMLIGYILEKIYGKPFPQILKEEVAVPLGMTDGGYDMEERIGALSAGSFMIRTSPVKEKVPTYYDLDGRSYIYKAMYPQYYYTAAAYFASVTDLAKWAVGLDRETLFKKDVSDGLIYGSVNIGDKKSAFSNVGWVLYNENGITFAGHTGGPGLGDILRFPNQGYTLIVLTNDGEVLPNFARAIAGFYIKELSAKLEISKFER